VQRQEDCDDLVSAHVPLPAIQGFTSLKDKIHKFEFHFNHDQSDPAYYPLQAIKKLFVEGEPGVKRPDVKKSRSRREHLAEPD
jgi:hypothetical protein